MNDNGWYLRTQDETFGPETRERLIEWAKLGRIQPGQEISDDNEIWQRVEEVPFLDMRFSIDLGDGNPRGPFNRAAAEALLASHRLPPTATMIEVRKPFDEDPVPPAAPVSPQDPVVPKDPIVPKDPVDPIDPKDPPVVEKIVEVIKEVPVEKIVEVIKEVPVEKIVEVIKEVPVEKIVIDETRVKELEGQLVASQSRAKELDGQLTESRQLVADAEKQLATAQSHAKELDEKLASSESRAKELDGQLAASQSRTKDLEGQLAESQERSAKLTEQVEALEAELKRIPQAASEVADIQAAVFQVMQDESADIAAALETERKEFEEAKQRFDARMERLQARRHELIKRSGGNLDEMTRKALIERPEDPRTARLRRDFEELQRVHEKAMRDSELKIRQLTDQVRECTAEGVRTRENLRDVTQLQAEAQKLREELQRTQKDLLNEKQRCEELRQREATGKQTLMARVAALESPSIGTVSTVDSNQSREARMVRLPSWMRIGR